MLYRRPADPFAQARDHDGKEPMVIAAVDVIAWLSASNAPTRVPTLDVLSVLPMTIEEKKRIARLDDQARLAVIIERLHADPTLMFSYKEGRFSRFLWVGMPSRLPNAVLFVQTPK